MQQTHQATLRERFDKASAHYDRMVGLNPGYHRHLKLAARILLAHVGKGARVLDMGCGSGASTAALLQQGAGSVFGVDASPGMIAQAQRKSWPAGTTFAVSAVEQLERFEHPQLGREFSGVMAAYLIRNVPAAQRDEALGILRRQLAPGGSLVLVEYALGAAWWPRLVWNLVCWLAVIPMAALMMQDTQLFRYLWKSVHEADRPEVLSRRLENAGFGHVRRYPVKGWQRGILHIWVAK